MNIFDLEAWEFGEQRGYTEEELLYQQQELIKEHQMWLTCCGSCINFMHYMAEAGFCKMAECNCVCKNPKAMISIWDDKCEKWEINPTEA